VILTSGSRLLASLLKFEGASGDIHENKGTGKMSTPNAGKMRGVKAFHTGGHGGNSHREHGDRLLFLRALRVNFFWESGWDSPLRV